MQNQKKNCSGAKKKSWYFPIAEKKEGGTGWKAQRWKQDILERACISIAKSNYEMLRCHCTAPYA